MSTAPTPTAPDAGVEHAEAVWRVISEAIDAVSESDRENFLTRLVLLAALDHLGTEELAELVAQARATR